MKLKELWRIWTYDPGDELPFESLPSERMVITVGPTGCSLLWYVDAYATAEHMWTVGGVRVLWNRKFLLKNWELT